MKRNRALRSVLVLALAVACRIPDEDLRVAKDGAITDAPHQDAAIDGDVIVPPDAPPPVCAVDGLFDSFDPVQGLGPLRSVARLSEDELTAYFALGPDGSVGSAPDTLFVATRGSGGERFGSAVQVTGVNTPDGQSTPSVSYGSGELLYYVWGEAPLHVSSTTRDIYRATRTGPGTFDSPIDLQVNGSGVEDDYPYVDERGDLWWGTKRGSDTNVGIYHATFTGGSSFGPPEPVTDLDAQGASETYPVVSADRQHIFFQRSNGQMFMANHTTNGGVTAFDAPASVESALASTCDGSDCRPAAISDDGCRLYVGVGAAGASSITMYVATKSPAVTGE